MWIHVTQVVPWWTSPLWHRVRLALTLAAVFVNHVYPVVNVNQWWLTSTWRHDVINFWQTQWQLVFWYKRLFTVFPVDDRNWLTPVTLTWEDPVTQAVVNLLVTNTLLFQPSDCLFDSFLLTHAIQETWVDVLTVASVSFFSDVTTGQNLAHWQIVLLSKFVVTRIVSRHGHHGTRSVWWKDIITNPNWQLFTINWVNCNGTCEHTWLILIQVRTLQIWLWSDWLLKGFDSILLIIRNNFWYQSVFWWQNQVRHTVQRISTRREDFNFSIWILHLEVYRSTDWATDPVTLLFLNGVWPINIVQIFQQAISVSRDLQCPLAHWDTVNWEATTLRLTVDDFFVGNNRSTIVIRGPVNHDFIFVCQALLVQLFEDPLRPLVVLMVSRVNLTWPVIWQTKCLHLAAEVLNVLCRHDTWILTRLDCVLFSRQTERVESHWVQNIEPLHTLHTWNDISCRVTFWVPNV